MKYVTLASSFVLLYVLWSTYDIGTKLDPKEHTISQIGNYGFRLEFIIWGITTGALFLWYILRLFELEEFKNKHVIKWVGVIFIVFAIDGVDPLDAGDISCFSGVSCDLGRCFWYFFIVSDVVFCEVFG